MKGQKIKSYTQEHYRPELLSGFLGMAVMITEEMLPVEFIYIV